MADMMTEPRALRIFTHPGAPARDRVAVDVGPIDVHPSGVSTYVSELVSALEILEPGRIVGIGEPPGRPVFVVLGTWLLPTSADLDAGRVDCALAHYTNGVASVRTRTLLVLTIDDLSLLRRRCDHRPAVILAPDCVGRPTRRRRHRAIARDTTRGRALHHTSSEWIVVVACGSSTRRRAGRRSDRTASRGVRIEPGRFVLSLGTIQRRKITPPALGVRAACRRGPRLRLVLVGRWGWGFAGSGALDRSRSATGSSSPGRGGRRRRRVAVIVCRDGLPVDCTRASACRCSRRWPRRPVITSAASALPETAGGAAVRVDRPTWGRSLQGSPMPWHEPIAVRRRAGACRVAHVARRGTRASTSTACRRPPWPRRDEFLVRAWRSTPLGATRRSGDRARHSPTPARRPRTPPRTTGRTRRPVAVAGQCR